MEKVKFTGTGIAWDAERNSVGFTFSGGSYTTSEPREIAVGRKCGFDEEILTKADPNLTPFVPPTLKVPKKAVSNERN
jgi:hypothetical protein